MKTVTKVVLIIGGIGVAYFALFQYTKYKLSRAIAKGLNDEVKDLHEKH